MAQSKKTKASISLAAIALVAAASLYYADSTNSQCEAHLKNIQKAKTATKKNNTDAADLVASASKYEKAKGVSEAILGKSEDSSVKENRPWSLYGLFGKDAETVVNTAFSEATSSLSGVKGWTLSKSNFELGKLPYSGNTATSAYPAQPSTTIPIWSASHFYAGAFKSGGFVRRLTWTRVTRLEGRAEVDIYIPTLPEGNVVSNGINGVVAMVSPNSTLENINLKEAGNIIKLAALKEGDFSDLQGKISALESNEAEQNKSLSPAELAAKRDDANSSRERLIAVQQAGKKVIQDFTKSLQESLSVKVSTFDNEHVILDDNLIPFNQPVPPALARRYKIPPGAFFKNDNGVPVLHAVIKLSTGTEESVELKLQRNEQDWAAIAEGR